MLKIFLVWLPMLLPVLAWAQEGNRTIYRAQGRVVILSFNFNHKDSNIIEKHSAFMRPDSFASEERLDNRMVASICGNYAQAYSKFFERVYEIPDSDFDQMARSEKQKIPGDIVYDIEIKTNGQTKHYEIPGSKKKDLPRRLLTQYKKVEELANAVRKEQNAYEKKQIILNNP